MRQFRRARESGRSSSKSENLFENLKEESMHIRALVLDWLRSYKADSDTSLFHMVQFILQCCGMPKRTLTLSDLESAEMDFLLDTIHEKGKECEDYPLTTKHKTYKNFYNNYQIFWMHLISEAGDSLYQNSFVPYTSNWLSSLSFSKLRPIRHTTTAGILSMVQALVDVFIKEHNELERVQTFINTEKRNGQTQRLEYLQEQEHDLLEKVQFLDSVIEDIYKDVLLYRVKDIMPEIRVLCTQALGYLSEKCPDKYLSPETLDAFGFLIYDKSSHVRERSLRALNYLFENKNPDKWSMFINQHKLRLVEMTHDVEHRCCVLAIKLNTHLARAGYLTEEQVGMLACLLWVDSEDIRKEAADFIGTAIFNDSLPDKNSLPDTLDQALTSKIQTGLLGLVDFYNQYADGLLFRMDLIVKAFWEKTCAVRSWETICALLKQETEPVSHTNSQIPQSQRSLSFLRTQSIPLVTMLISSMKHLSDSPKYKNGAVHLSAAVINHMPELLEFYKADTCVLEELTKVFKYIELNALASQELQAPFIILIKQIHDLNLETCSEAVMRNTAQGLARFATEPHRLQQEAKQETHKLSYTCMENLRKNLHMHLLEGEMSLLEFRLCRIASLLSVIDITHELGGQVYDDLCHLISQYLADVLLPSHKIALYCCEILFYWHLWILDIFCKDPQDEVSYLKFRDSAIELFAAIVAKEDANQDLRESAFKYLCETLVVVSGQSAMSSPIYYEVHPDVWKTIEDYMTGTSVNVETPSNVFLTRGLIKRGARMESGKEEANESTQLICLLLTRLICMCPSLTTSQLPSSFLAHFGHSHLRSVNMLTKQVLQNFKNKDTQQTGPFADPQLFYNIALESLVKCMGHGQSFEITQMKELGQKIAQVIGPGPLRPKQADRLVSFILDSVSFAFSDKDNFPLLEGLINFVHKNYLNSIVLQDLYQKVSADAQKIEEMLRKHDYDVEVVMAPVRHLLGAINKRGYDENPQQSGRKEMMIEQSATNGKRRTRSPISDEETPEGRPQSELKKKKIK